MNEFKIPDEWRKEFINAYIPLIAGIESVGVYKNKIEGLTTEEVYKVIYFCEVSNRKEWLEGMSKFDEPHRSLALRYLNCRGTIVPRLAIPFSVRSKIYIKYLVNLSFFFSIVCIILTIINEYLFINLVAYSLLILLIIALIFLKLGNK
tara:strand:- start:40 stop:486 length:447 start_codon:yes stop_codon:yes gene_type:complete